MDDGWADAGTREVGEHAAERVELVARLGPFGFVGHREVGADPLEAQLGPGLRYEAVRLCEDGAPARTHLEPLSCGHEISQAHPPFHGHRRDLPGEMNEIADEAARQR